MARPNDIRPDTKAHRMRLADLSTQSPTRFALVPPPETREAIGRELDLIGLPKLRFEGTLRTEGRAGWRLEAMLGATVVQPCSVTLAPVTTRIDEPVTRRYSPDADPGGELPAEMEMPEDETLDPLPEVVDLLGVMLEALALALPLYPRAVAAAGTESYKAQPPGAEPLTDEAVKPFSGLAGLRDRLGGKS